MDENQSHTDDTIVPIKLVKKELIGEGSLSRAKLVEDTEKARLEYDSRVYSNVPLSDETAHFRLFTFFDFKHDDKTNDERNDRLKEVYRWVKSATKSDDTVRLVRYLNDLEMRIGQPDFGMDRLDHIYNYVKIENQIKDLEQEKIYRYGI